ncbi:PDZ domain-containing protein [Streptomyces sp. NPDC002588]|uniref:PDZ domain-containing protein n=1 Tax=Streptomyces sp. NPDC002588 TaxID=3154419 RepID=UPI003327C98D
MEQTALRPKPMPGQEGGGGAEPSGGPARRPRAARRRRRRRLPTLLLGLSAAALLVLSGVGLAVLGATVTGLSGPAGLQRQQADRGEPLARPVASAPPVPLAPSQARATLGLEAVDAEGPGARIVAVHVPGPGYAAGLVRGDVLLAFGGIRIDSATDLARAVGTARPGREVTLTVLPDSGGRRQLVVVPGVVT